MMKHCVSKTRETDRNVIFFLESQRERGLAFADQILHRSVRAFWSTLNKIEVDSSGIERDAENIPGTLTNVEKNEIERSKLHVRRSRFWIHVGYTSSKLKRGRWKCRRVTSKKNSMNSCEDTHLLEEIFCDPPGISSKVL